MLKERDLEIWPVEGKTRISGLQMLERQGFLRISDKKYYLSDIIRQGVRYKVGATPKVLSLLIK